MRVGHYEWQRECQLASGHACAAATVQDDWRRARLFADAGQPGVDSVGKKGSPALSEKPGVLAT